MPDIFEFEELIADMLGVSDDDRNENEQVVEEAFFDEFEIEFDSAYKLACRLLPHTPTIETSLTKTIVHAFVSKDQTTMLMSKIPSRNK